MHKKDFVVQKHVACAQKCKYGLPCQTNLANDACQQNFSQNQHFLKQKNNQLIFFKKIIDQSDSCGFFPQLRRMIVNR